MSGLDLYLDHVRERLERVIGEERNNIERAAELVAAKIREGKPVHVFGPGVHSMIGVEEAFYRKGGLIPIVPYLVPGLSAFAGARAATLTEGRPEYAEIVLQQYGLAEGDVLVVFNAYGFNACAVQAAFTAKSVGAKTVAFTSREYANQVPDDQPNRHPTGKRLHEVADVVVDIKMAAGETVVPIDGLPGRAGATATILHAFAWNCVVIRVAKLLRDSGVAPPIWCVEALDFTWEQVERFRPHLRHL